MNEIGPVACWVVQAWSWTGDGESDLIGASNAEEGLAIGQAIKRTRGDGRTGTWQAGPADEAGGTGGRHKCISLSPSLFHLSNCALSISCLH